MVSPECPQLEIISQEVWSSIWEAGNEFPKPVQLIARELDATIATTLKEPIVVVGTQPTKLARQPPVKLRLKLPTRVALSAKRSIEDRVAGSNLGDEILEAVA
jgi:hypothetical protein